MRVRLTALLSAVLMAVLWASPLSVAYLCSMDGERRAGCCCAPDGEDAECDDSKVQRQACCEVERSPANVASAVAPWADDAGLHLASQVWTRERGMAGGHAGTDFVPTLARGPPLGIGPPPYLRNCRLVI